MNLSLKGPHLIPYPVLIKKGEKQGLKVELVSFEKWVNYLVSIEVIIPAKRKRVPKGVKRLGGLQRFLMAR